MKSMNEEHRKRLSEIVRITAKQLKNGKWRYFTHFKDGTIEVIRKSCTRLYDNAFQYDGRATNQGADLAIYFCWGQKPPTQKATHAPLQRTHRIEKREEPKQ